MKIFQMPDLGEGLQDAEVITWHVAVGDRVVADQPLVSVETDKAVVEVPSPWSGMVRELHAKPGDIVRIGAPLVGFEPDQPRVDTGAVVGELPTPPEQKTSPSEDMQVDVSSPTHARAAPAARKLAKEWEIDIEGISGTGPNGAITRADVEAIIAKERLEPYVPLRGMRRSMAHKMARAHAEVAAASVTDEAKIAHWSKQEDITCRLVRATIAACIVEPALSAWYDAKRKARRLHARIDLGIAVNTDEGLFVPVLRDVSRLTEKDLRASLDVIRGHVASRSAPPEMLRDATLTLSNFGMLGGQHAFLVVVPPQVAIVGAGRISDEVRVFDGEIRTCRVLPLSLTIDHRAVTGAEAIRFLTAMIKDLEE